MGTVIHLNDAARAALQAAASPQAQIEAALAAQSPFENMPRGSTTVINANRIVTSSSAKVTVQDLSPDQREVYDAVLSWFHRRPWESGNPRERVFTLGGLAGTGKTTVLSLLLEELAVNRRKQLCVMTPTGKAATVLSRKLGRLAPFCAHLGTIHSFMYVPILNHNEELTGWGKRFFEKQGEGENATYVAKSGKIPKLDLLVVDESSMLNQDLEDDILAFNMPVLAVGDHGQLPPVNGRNTWMQKPRMRLEKIHRQAEDNPILALATYVRETGELPRNRAVALQDIGIGFYSSLKEASPSFISTFEQRGFQDTALITYTNELRCRLNAGIHKHFLQNAEPTEGTQVICLKNNTELGLVNGMRGRIRNKPTKQGVWLVAEVEFPDENVLYQGPFVAAQFGLPGLIPNVEEASKLLGVQVPTMKKLGAFLDYGYALTCHKAQGSEFSDVFVVLQQGRTPQDYARWIYTAITRASQRLSFVETWG